jgi:antitoxin (DNA-binding transcriptional repressor) of toxin-antitoxin stability system
MSLAAAVRGGIILNMPTIRISEADAARDFPDLMARVRAGIEFVIEIGTQPVAVLRAAGGGPAAPIPF